MSAPLAIAFAAGLLAAVNPCGFALLPGFLGLYLGGRDDADGEGRRALGETPSWRRRARSSSTAAVADASLPCSTRKM